MKYILCVFICLQMNWANLSLFAQDTLLNDGDDIKPELIKPDRPGFGDAVFLTPTKRAIIETGMMYEWGHPKPNLYSDAIYWNLTLLRYGISKNVEIRFEHSLYQSIMLNTFSNTQSEDDVKEEKIGLLPMRAGFKTKLLANKGWIPAVSFIGMMGMPWTATKNLRPSYVTADVQLSFSNMITKRVMIAYNLGANFDGSSANPTYYYAASVEMDMAKMWASYIQMHGAWQTTRTAQGNITNLTPAIEGGILFFPALNIQLDISVGILFPQDASKASGFISSGFSWRLLQ